MTSPIVETDGETGGRGDGEIELNRAVLGYAPATQRRVPNS